MGSNNSKSWREFERRFVLKHQGEDEKEDDNSRLNYEVDGAGLWKFLQIQKPAKAIKRPHFRETYEPLHKEIIAQDSMFLREYCAATHNSEATIWFECGRSHKHIVQKRLEAGAELEEAKWTNLGDKT